MFRRVFAAAHPVPRHVVTLCALALIAACGDAGKASNDSGGNKQAAAASGDGAGTSACASPDTTPVGLATRAFIEKAEPSAQRFLSAVGTDSALPDDGFKVLQDKGPTYYYSGEPKAQKQIMDKLANDGPWATLLVVYRGSTPSDGGNVVDVRLGGHYVGGEHNGTTAATKRFQVKCDANGWSIASTTTEDAGAR